MIKRVSISALSIWATCLFGLSFFSPVSASGAEPGFEFRRAVFYIEPGLIIWTLVTFGVLLVILKTLAWRPIMDGLKNREERIRKDLERAEEAWKEAEEKANALANRLEAAKAEALAIIEEGRADAVKLKNSIMEEAQAEAQAIRERSKTEIELAKQQALKEIWDQTADLATQVASKMIEKELSAKDHQNLVKSCIEEYNQIHA